MVLLLVIVIVVSAYTLKQRNTTSYSPMSLSKFHVHVLTMDVLRSVCVFLCLQNLTKSLYNTTVSLDCLWASEHFNLENIITWELC